ncbi:MAG: TIGR00266 family protein [Candidatus Eiseniibacteriota bacterium]|jgi:uncharacterized protein (TIGR00266 family)
METRPAGATPGYELIGDDMQAVVVSLTAGQTVRAEAGSLMFKTAGVSMDARMEGGLLGGLKRKLLAGESFFITNFTCEAPSGRLAFSAPYPGKILAHELAGDALMCQKDAYLCSLGDIDIDIAFTKRLGAGFFGGEGFILEKLSGQGLVFVHAGGTLLTTDLGAGEALEVDTGCLVAFQPSVDYDIQRVGGVKTTLFGGEGLFFARLTGPGRVFLQTLPFSRLADRIAGAFRGGQGEQRRGGSLSSALGNLISGD